MDYACPHVARRRALGAILHSQATTADDDERKSEDGISFIRKLITDTIDCQNILRLAGFDFDLTAKVLDMRVNCAFIGFKGHAMDCIQQLRTSEDASGLAR